MNKKYDPGYILFISVIIAMLNGFATVTAKSENIRYNWQQTDSSVALLGQGKIVWQFNFPDTGKPYFHPLNTTDGTTLTWFSPPDHPWHRGLWFSWKYINGLNYWEQDRNTGLSEGFTRIKNVIFNPNPDYSAQIIVDIEYSPPDKPAALNEKRVLIISLPDENGNYYIDWKSTFTAGQDPVFLERTPILGQPDGKSWGGYAGLGCRINSRSLTSIKFVDSEGRQDLNIHSKPARWIHVDGFIKEDTTRSAGLTIFDYPTNPRYPPPGFVIKDWLKDHQLLFAYMNPGFLFEKGFTLKAGDSFALKYRILIHNGFTEPAEIENLFEQFTRK